MIVAIAAVLGTAAGAWSARWMTNLYSDFYRFPTRLYQLSAASVAFTLGGQPRGRGHRCARLGPPRHAHAARPGDAAADAAVVPARRFAERLHVDRFLGTSAMMVVRELERRPLRFLLSSTGIALGVAIFLLGRFSWDSFEYLMNETFVRGHREDITVTLRRSGPDRAVCTSSRRCPACSTPRASAWYRCGFRFGSRWRDTSIIGLQQDSALRTLLDGDERPVAVPEHGALISTELSERIGAGLGDTVEVEVLEQDWPIKTLTVEGLIDEPFGMLVYARADWLSSWLGEQPRVSAVLASIDPDRASELRARLKELPEVLGVASTQHSIDLYREQTGGSMVFFTLVLTISAAAIAMGVVYNNARIALSLRSRDLSTLRVLGFTRREISTVLLGELGAQVVVGIPLGLLLGTWGAHGLAAAMGTEVMRLHVHIASTTYATAAMIAFVAGIASALLVRRNLDRLDLIGVLIRAAGNKEDGPQQARPPLGSCRRRTHRGRVDAFELRRDGPRILAVGREVTDAIALIS